ncbi:MULTISPECIES: acyltransferase [unclassified Pseudoalteromonas]|uniref:acyltransferase n=1 Tax=unclassified Pseudoalteromonas TaxID=194690 RepID=UPI000CF6E3FC|nr:MULTISPECIES: acyltransferase [unclassified Pseudoalteromonas]
MRAVVALFRQIVSIGLYTLNTLFWFLPIVLCGVFKLIPIRPWQKAMSALAKTMASCWVAGNSLNQKLITPYKLKVIGLEQLRKKDWYLLVANHQSWVDILVMQRIFRGRIPFLNFFLKKELLYVPFLGLAWWALDFPFMKRTSKSQLKKNPKLRGKDIETTRKACEKFKEMPVSIVNFVEGTRYTDAKHQRQNSPFNHLLKPKAGGIAFVLQAMGEQISKIVNVTIHYPGGIPTFMDFAGGRVKEVVVHVEVRPLDSQLIGDYSNDNAFRVEFQQHLNALWQEKDSTLKQLTQQNRN